MINDTEVTDVALIIEETVKSFGELFMPDELDVDVLVLMVKTAVEEMTPFIEEMTPSTEQPEVIIEQGLVEEMTPSTEPEVIIE